MHEASLTAVVFIGVISAVIHSITDWAGWDATSCVLTLELFFTTCCTH